MQTPAGFSESGWSLLFGGEQQTDSGLNLY